jgi:hypothetical protein
MCLSGPTGPYGKAYQIALRVGLSSVLLLLM